MPKSPKKSSKANTPSWRTMLRQATALENQSERAKGVNRASLKARADALREQANLKHRSERAKAKAPAKKRKTVKKRVAARLSKADPMAQAFYGDNAAPATLGGINREASPAWQNNALAARGEQPGHGEIVGGAMHMLTEEITTLARKKGGKDEIQNKLATATATARYEGERAADQRNRRQLIEVNEAYRDKVVCGFIAEIEMQMTAKGGIPPDTVYDLNAFTVCRIIDVLNACGYTAKGKR